MVRRVEQETHQFPDGSEVTYAIRSSDATSVRVLRAELARRLQRAHRVFADGAATGVGAVASGRRDTRRSSTTHSLPEGEVRVSIDASGTGSHAYLQALVRGAVAYTNALDVEVGRAGAVAVLLLAGGLAVAAAGPAVLSLPLFGAGGIVGLHLALYVLSARGLAPALSRIPEPGGRTR